MTPPPSVGTVRHRGCTLHGVSRTYTQKCAPPRADTGPAGARVRWTRPIVDADARLLDVVCEAWPLWQDTLAVAGLYGATAPPVITVEGEDDLVLVFTADVPGGLP